jgi:threonyl-tRNA synthetase
MTRTFFCTEAQVLPETEAFIDLLEKVYADFGFTDIIVKLSTRPEKRIGSDAQWDRAEAALGEGLEGQGSELRGAAGRGRVSMARRSSSR